MRRAGARGGRRHRGRGHRRRRAARRPDGRQAEPGRLRLRPVQRCDLRRFAERRVPGPDAASRASPRSTPRCSATRRPTCRTGARGRPATSSASACSTSSRASSTSIRSTSAAATTSSATSRRSPCSPASRSSASPPRSRSSRRRGSSTGTGFRRRQADAQARGPVPRASASPRTSRPRRGRGSRARRTWPRRSWARRSAHVSLEDDGSVRIVTRQQPHGQSHETTLAQVAVDELGVRFEDVKVVFGDTDVTPFALVGTGGSRAATLANGVVLHASRELREQDPRRWPRTCSRPAPPTSRSTTASISVQGSPAVQLPLARARPHRGGGAGATPRGRRHRARGDAASTTAARAAGRAAPTCAEVEVDVETGLVSDRPLRGGRGLRAAGEPGDRRGPDPRRRRPGDRRGAARARGVRRGRAVPGVDVHGLPDADDDGRAELRDPPRRDDPHRSRRQLPRRRRGRDDRRPGVHHERDRGRARAARRAGPGATPPTVADPRARSGWCRHEEPAVRVPRAAHPSTRRSRSLAEHGDEAKVLAGGQSLVPLLAMRLARPAQLVDINEVAELVGHPSARRHRRRLRRPLDPRARRRAFAARGRACSRCWPRRCR